MSTIEELLKGRKVEWKKLGEVCVRTKGTNITAAQMKQMDTKNGQIKIFAGGRTVAFVNYGDIPIKDIQDIPSIIVKSRGIIEFEYYDKPFSHKNEMWAYHSENESVDVKYIYYYLKNNEYYFQNLGSKMQMPQISIKDTENYLIPIPPIDVQREIVEILDNFTTLTAELQKKLQVELDARAVQYEYYRDKLLTFNDIDKVGGKSWLTQLFGSFTVEWKKLGEVCEIQNGYTPSKKNEKFWTNGTIPWFKLEDIRTNGSVLSKALNYVTEKAIKKKTFKPNSVILSTTATIGVAAIVTVPFICNQQLTCLTPKESLLTKFLYYYLCSCENELFAIANSSGGIFIINQTSIKQFPIPLPPLPIQKEIVKILDQFSTLTTSMEEGLPREIALREQQYQYYRDRLLDFQTAESGRP